MMKEILKKIIAQAAGASPDDFSVEAPANKNFGDYSTNVALVLKKNPNEIAEKIKSDLFKKVEVENGFINFFVEDKVFLNAIKKIDKNFGRNSELKNKKVIIDYTDPNPFKEFHIGHLMSNAIGESLSRIFEFQGAKVKRVCYQGDVGIHVAKAIWGKMRDKDLQWGQAYAFGAKMYEDDESAKNEIIELNKKIYNRSDKKTNELYDQGKKESTKHFDEIYKKLDTKFDYFIFESETGPLGKKIVEKGLEKGIFEKGEGGAVIFKGENYGLHTRVFVNSDGLPTYGAKDLALAEVKFKKYKYDKSVVVTAVEQNSHFEVMLKAMEQIMPDLAKKTKHIGHGMLRLPEGKMSSRTGKIITGESLISQVEDLIKQKIAGRDLTEKEKAEISQKVAVGAIRYSILKQAIGSDIIYDFNKSISFEGDSGPYLQYAYTRARSVFKKAKKEGVKPSFKNLPDKIFQLEKTMSHFPEIVLQSGKKYEPHHMLLYLTELAGEFNSYYAENKIVDKNEEFSPYRVALTSAFAQIMKNGMWLLGIQTLEKM